MNIDAWDLWQLINTQWIVGMSGIVGLDWDAAIALAKETRTKWTPALFAKIKALEVATISKAAKSDPA